MATKNWVRQMHAPFCRRSDCLDSGLAFPDRTPSTIFPAMFLVLTFMKNRYLTPLGFAININGAYQLLMSTLLLTFDDSIYFPCVDTISKSPFRTVVLHQIFTRPSLRCQ